MGLVTRSVQLEPWKELGTKRQENLRASVNNRLSIVHKAGSEIMDAWEVGTPPCFRIGIMQ